MLVPSAEMRATGDSQAWKIMRHRAFLLFFALIPCTVLAVFNGGMLSLASCSLKSSMVARML